MAVDGPDITRDLRAARDAVAAVFVVAQRRVRDAAEDGDGAPAQDLLDERLQVREARLVVRGRGASVADDGVELGLGAALDVREDARGEDGRDERRARRVDAAADEVGGQRRDLDVAEAVGALLAQERAREAGGRAGGGGAFFAEGVEVGPVGAGVGAQHGGEAVEPRGQLGQDGQGLEEQVARDDQVDGFHALERLLGDVVVLARDAPPPADDGDGADGVALDGHDVVVRVGEEVLRQDLGLVALEGAVVADCLASDDRVLRHFVSIQVCQGYKGAYSEFPVQPPTVAVHQRCLVGLGCVY